MYQCWKKMYDSRESDQAWERKQVQEENTRLWPTPWITAASVSVGL